MYQKIVTGIDGKRVLLIVEENKYILDGEYTGYKRDDLGGQNFICESNGSLISRDPPEVFLKGQGLIQ
jgi:hypothetical protein